MVHAAKLDPRKPASVSLFAAATIEGRVFDEQGRPVPGAELEVIGTSTLGHPVQLSAAADGTPARQDGAGTEAQAAGGGDNLGVTQGRVPKIPLLPTLGDLTLGDGSALGASRGEPFRSGADGRFALRGVPPGSRSATCASSW